MNLPCRQILRPVPADAQLATARHTGIIIMYGQAIRSAALPAAFMFPSAICAAGTICAAMQYALVVPCSFPLQIETTHLRHPRRACPSEEVHHEILARYGKAVHAVAIIRAAGLLRCGGLQI